MARPRTGETYLKNPPPSKFDQIRKAIPLVYVAGPYRAATQELVQENIRKARTDALLIATFGGYPVTPHLNTAEFDFLLTRPPADDFWLLATQKLLLQCDMVFLVQNWEYSAGSRAENDLAREAGIPVHTTLSGIRDAIKSFRRG